MLPGLIGNHRVPDGIINEGKERVSPVDGKRYLLSCGEFGVVAFESTSGPPNVSRRRGDQVSINVVSGATEALDEVRLQRLGRMRARWSVLSRNTVVRGHKRMQCHSRQPYKPKPEKGLAMRRTEILNICRSSNGQTGLDRRSRSDTPPGVSAQ